MALDWEFLFAWGALLAVVAAPVRLVVLAAPLPDVLAWPVIVGALAGTFAAADWLDRAGFDRLGVADGGPAAFLVVQFVVAPTVALAVAPPGTAGPDGLFAALERPGATAASQAWAAFVPALRPRVVRPVWLVVHLLALPLSVWLGLYGGLARFGLDPRRSAVFALTLGALVGLSALLVPALPVSPAPTDRELWLAVLACEGLAAGVAYGPTPAKPVEDRSPR